MPDYGKQIAKAKDQLKQVSEDLEIWTAFGPTTVTDGATGKATDLRAAMIERCNQNIDLYKRIIAGYEKKTRET